MYKVTNLTHLSKHSFNVNYTISSITDTTIISIRVEHRQCRDEHFLELIRILCVVVRVQLGADNNNNNIILPIDFHCLLTVSYHYMQALYMITYTMLIIDSFSFLGNPNG